MMDGFPKSPPHPSAVSENPEIVKSVDERISFDQSSRQWIYEVNKDGKSMEYQYDFSTKKWLEKEQDEYGSISVKKRTDKEAEIDKEEEENKQEIKRLKKEKLQKMKDEINRLKNQKKQINTSNDAEQSQTNTGVYVSNLPSDVTKDELVEIFSKYGLISEDYKTGEPRVKLYYENDVFKNEALIIYHNMESVSLVIEMLDGAIIRPPSDKYQNKVKVQQAQFNSNKNNGISIEKKTLTPEEKQLLIEKKEMMKKKLSSWDEDETVSTGQDKFNQIKKKIYDKIVVIEQMFRKEELKQDPLLEMDLKEDIQDECNELGIGNDITKINVYDISGAVTIKFSNPQSSSKCVEAFNGRYFDGLKLKVYTYNGEKFDKSRPENINDNDSDRLNSFGNWLEKK